MRKSKTITVLSLGLFLGLHWAVLQSVAWVTMIAAYSEQDTFLVAVSKTFDGRHPCDLCVAIQGARSDESGQDSPRISSQTQRDWVFETPAVVYVAPAPMRHSFVLIEFNSGIPPLRPPTPPPRSLCVA